ncbi:uncharacterized protein LOC131957485 [Physella acuta]|uniref:uncharacterized protein LOC131957485 n=1 Tax=Physella acuta TaxID=109671 RepID=UPI0027DCCE90|nr:uncharacterized protein LOC131957485 [Physella acuta]
MSLYLMVLLLLLPAIQCRNDSFRAIILGFERDCIHSYCNYTGRLYGYFWHPFKQYPHDYHCGILLVEYCRSKNVKDCGGDGYFSEWDYQCVMWSVCNPKEICGPDIRDECNCLKGNPYYFSIRPVNFDYAKHYRLVFNLGVSISNTFDITKYPDDWDRDVPRETSLESKGGKRRLKPESILIYLGAVFAVGLANIRL